MKPTKLLIGPHHGEYKFPTMQGVEVTAIGYLVERAEEAIKPDIHLETLFPYFNTHLHLKETKEWATKDDWWGWYTEIKIDVDLENKSEKDMDLLTTYVFLLHKHFVEAFQNIRGEDALADYMPFYHKTIRQILELLGFEILYPTWRRNLLYLTKDRTDAEGYGYFTEDELDDHYGKTLKDPNKGIEALTRLEKNVWQLTRLKYNHTQIRDLLRLTQTELEGYIRGINEKLDTNY